MQQSTSAPPNHPEPKLSKEDFIRSELVEDYLHQTELLLCLSYFLEAPYDKDAYKLITLAQMQDQQTNAYIIKQYELVFNQKTLQNG